MTKTGENMGGVADPQNETPNRNPENPKGQEQGPLVASRVNMGGLS